MEMLLILSQVQLDYRTSIVILVICVLAFLFLNDNSEEVDTTNLEVVEKDGHEYIVFKSTIYGGHGVGSAGGICHSENCKFCKST